MDSPIVNSILVFRR